MTETAVDRPLIDVVLDAIDADDTLKDDAKYLVLAALGGEKALHGQLDGVTTPEVRGPAQRERCSS
ncbi:hypothetical protein [Rhodococcoides fascians]|uniref:hypothetical protein n=1 Tax=Rhodococcoides fascians TaxID=1828 RepID=UPI00068EA5CD|nr:hypothetical protein [Rhodococcus fascians]